MIEIIVGIWSERPQCIPNVESNPMPQVSYDLLLGEEVVAA